MSSRKVDRVLAEAFSIWSSATSLKFKLQRTGKVHIDLRFERKDHGDEDPFDGKGRAVALPQIKRLTALEASLSLWQILGGCHLTSETHQVSLGTCQASLDTHPSKRKADFE